uniref:Uncharacterized protein n=1 Tax=Ciona intestinalis TaxID=7719 RepID=H2XSS5_CIOIN
MDLGSALDISIMEDKHTSVVMKNIKFEHISFIFYLT